MRSRKNRILFISHNASRSGAPMVLLYLLQWIKQETQLEFDVLLLSDGELRAKFEEVANTYVATEIFEQGTIISRLKRKFLFKNNPVPWRDYVITKVTGHLKYKKYRLVYGNTISTLPWVLKYKNYGAVKCLCAIHELRYGLERFFSNSDLKESLPLLDLILAGSEAVARHLTVHLGIPAAKIVTAHAFISTTIKPFTPPNQIRRQLGIESDAFLIGCAASAEWRKGIDLFVLLAVQLRKAYRDTPFKLLWVGGKSTDPALIEARYDVEKCGLASSVIFVESTEAYLDYINAFDVFLLLSREDPFPLVNLEAALLQKIIVAFENSGGTDELISEGGGRLVPYLDIPSLADTLYYIYRNKNLALQEGAKGKVAVETKFNSKIMVAKIVSEIERLMD